MIWIAQLDSLYTIQYVCMVEFVIKYTYSLNMYPIKCTCTIIQLHQIIICSCIVSEQLSFYRIDKFIVWHSLINWFWSLFEAIQERGWKCLEHLTTSLQLYRPTRSVFFNVWYKNSNHLSEQVPLTRAFRLTCFSTYTVTTSKPRLFLKHEDIPLLSTILKICRHYITDC